MPTRVKILRRGQSFPFTSLGSPPPLPCSPRDSAPHDGAGEPYAMGVVGQRSARSRSLLRTTSFYAQPLEKHSYSPFKHRTEAQGGSKRHGTLAAQRATQCAWPCANSRMIAGARGVEESGAGNRTRGLSSRSPSAPRSSRVRASLLVSNSGRVRDCPRVPPALPPSVHFGPTTTKLHVKSLPLPHSVRQPQ